MKKIALLFCLISGTLTAFSQDTIPAKKAYVSNHTEISRKTGKILRAWPHWIKVKSGKIESLGSNTYLINGKDYQLAGNVKMIVKN